MASNSAENNETPSSVLGRFLHNELVERTKAQRRSCKLGSQNFPQVAEVIPSLNSNGNSEIKEQSFGTSVAQNASTAVGREAATGSLSTLSRCDLRDVVIFASKQIYERGFESLKNCYYDFGFDVLAVEALASLFKDVDADKDGRLGINDISLWISSHGGCLNSAAAANAINNFKQGGGFLSKLDFVRLILQQEMTKKTEEEEEEEEEGGGKVASDDLLWAVFTAMDANRDGWISVEDFRRLCRPLKYELSGREGRTISGQTASGSGGGSLKGLLNFRDFKTFVETGKVDRERKHKPCSIQ